MAIGLGWDNLLCGLSGFGTPMSGFGTPWVWDTHNLKGLGLSGFGTPIIPGGWDTEWVWDTHNLVGLGHP